MTRLRRFFHLLGPVALMGACAQIIGLDDYEKGDHEVDNGGGEGNRVSGGAGGTVPKGGGGAGGEDNAGTAGVLQGGQAGRGGATAEGGAGAGGEGGQSGQGGSDTGGTTGGGGASGGTAGSGGMSGSGGSPPCTDVTASMTLVDQIIERDVDQSLVSYVFRINPGIGLSSAEDLLAIEFWNGDPYDGILTGAFPLGVGRDSNNSTCSRCFLAYQDSDASASLRKTFFQTAGTLTIEESSQQMDGFPNISYSNVTLREATIDPNDFHSTIVPGGECLQFASGSFSLAPVWSCDPSYQGDNECDCGCGIPDPDCAGDAAVTACIYCWCDGTGNCTDFESPTRNWMCL